MEKYLKEHIEFMEKALQKESPNFDGKTLGDFNRTQIGFFQHERLIHLLVTLFFGLIFFTSVVINLWLVNTGILTISVILVIMLGFYIRHYFVLENGVQKLYRLEKEIIQRGQKKILE